MSILWSIDESFGKDARVTIIHIGGRSVYRIENDIDGSKLFLESGSGASDDDIEELEAELHAYEATKFIPVPGPQYRSKDPL